MSGLNLSSKSLDDFIAIKNSYMYCFKFLSLISTEFDLCFFKITSNTYEPGIPSGKL